MVLLLLKLFNNLVHFSTVTIMVTIKNEIGIVVSLYTSIILRRQGCTGSDRFIKSSMKYGLSSPAGKIVALI